MFRDKNRSTLRIGLSMFVMSAICKAIGFIRQMLMAKYFGTGDVVDSYVMAQSIPNILLGGILVAFATAYMPLFSKRYEEEGEDAANRYTSKHLLMLFLLSVVVTALGVTFSKGIVKVFAPGLSPIATEMTAFYLKFTFGYTFFVSTVGILSNYLQYKGIFTSQIVGDYLQNISFILFIWIGYQKGYKLLILGPFLGYALRWAFLFFLTKKEGLQFKFDTSGMGEILYDIGSYALPVFIGTTVFEINTYVDRYLAAKLPSGSISALNYANQLSAVMMELTITILATLLYPKLVKAVTTKAMGQFKEYLSKGIDMCGLIALPLALASVLYSKEIISLIFERGAFVSDSTLMTADAYLYYSIGVFFLAITTYLTKAYYSLGNMITPMWCAITGVIVNIAGDYLLIDVMGINGLALATSIAHAVNAILLILMFRREKIGTEALKGGSQLIKIGIASVGSIGGIYICYKAVGYYLGNAQIILFLAAVLLSVLAYVILLEVLKVDEIKQVMGLITHGKK